MARDRLVSRRATAESIGRGLNVGFVKEVVAELRRVTWPSRDETIRLTLMVIAVSVAVGILLGGIDLGFARLFKAIVGR